jgi:hypothetical protein
MQRLQYECHDIDSSLCAKMLRVSHERPLLTIPANEIARRVACPGLETTAAVAFIWRNYSRDS